MAPPRRKSPATPPDQDLVMPSLAPPASIFTIPRIPIPPPRNPPAAVPAADAKPAPARNGKDDRRKMVSFPEDEEDDRGISVEPHDRIEEQKADLWKENFKNGPRGSDTIWTKLGGFRPGVILGAGINATPDPRRQRRAPSSSPTRDLLQLGEEADVVLRDGVPHMKVAPLPLSSHARGNMPRRETPVTLPTRSALPEQPSDEPMEAMAEFETSEEPSAETVVLTPELAPRRRWWPSLWATSKVDFSDEAIQDTWFQDEPVIIPDEPAVEFPLGDPQPKPWGSPKTPKSPHRSTPPSGARTTNAHHPYINVSEALRLRRSPMAAMRRDNDLTPPPAPPRNPVGSIVGDDGVARDLLQDNRQTVNVPGTDLRPLAWGLLGSALLLGLSLMCAGSVPVIGGMAYAARHLIPAFPAFADEKDTAIVKTPAPKPVEDESGWLQWDQGDYHDEDGCRLFTVPTPDAMQDFNTFRLCHAHGEPVCMKEKAPNDWTKAEGAILVHNDQGCAFEKVVDGETVEVVDKTVKVKQLTADRTDDLIAPNEFNYLLGQEPQVIPGHGPVTAACVCTGGAVNACRVKGDDATLASTSP